MFIDILVNSAAVLIISFVIAKRAQIVDSLQLSKNLEKYLFHGNNVHLTFTSNIGSMLSITLIFSLFLVGIGGYGLITFFAVGIGLFLANCLVLLLLRSTISHEQNGEMSYKFTTYIDLLTNSSKKSYFKAIFILEYYIFLVLEFSVLNIFLKGLFPESIISVIILSLFIAFLCATYTTVGGYSGILRTDFFQVIIFIFGFLLILSIKSDSVLTLIKTNIINKPFFPPSFLPVFTVILFTTSWFSSFPDFWIRNLSTLQVDKESKKKCILASYCFMIVSLIPLTIIGLPLLDFTNHFSYSFDVKRTLNFYINLFNTYLSTNNHPFITWAIISSFVCIFITTIDTWLKGIMQHLTTKAKTQNPDFIALLPYISALSAAIIAYYPSQSGIFMLGLISFPFLFLNTCMLITIILNKMQNYHNLFLQIFAIGLITTIFLMYIWSNCMNENAFAIILVTACIQFLYFILCKYKYN